MLERRSVRGPRYSRAPNLFQLPGRRLVVLSAILIAVRYCSFQSIRDLTAEFDLSFDKGRTLRKSHVGVAELLQKWGSIRSAHTAAETDLSNTASSQLKIT